MNPMFPYVVKLHEGVQPRDIINAGGELLERFNIPRSTVDFALVKQVRKNLGPLVTRMPAPGGMRKG